MKRLVMAAVALAAASLAAGSVQAKPIPDAGLTLEEVKAWMESDDYKVTIETYDSGTRYLRSDTDGVKFDVDFYDCDKDRCRALQLNAGFDMDDGLPQEKVNQWNREKRYLRCYDDDSGDPHFAYDVNVAPGGTYEALKDDMDVFAGFLPDVLKFIGW